MNKSIKLVVIFLIGTLFVGVLVWRNASPSSGVTIHSSEHDKRSYRYIELANQLRVLLISDPETDKAAAALNVHVGSGNDPSNALGLAHFLEHMLFLGTEKYPATDSYQQFINAHRGQHNAYTSFADTQYFFAVDPDAFDQALDRFASFFIAPLFNADYVEREKNAVHAEYVARIQDDQRRYVDVLKEIMNPAHPFTRFTVGNLDTLQDHTDQSLREQLLTFYRHYYSANAMTLVVLGQASLDALADKVERFFSAIPDKAHTSSPSMPPLFADDTLPLRVTLEPVKEQRTLSLIFPLASPRAHYQKKPLDYLAMILGHEGNGSLLAFLKAQSWAEALQVSTAFDDGEQALLTLDIGLTPTGLAQRHDVISAVFQAIHRIQQEGEQIWLFDEQAQLAQQAFDYQETSTAIADVSGLATTLHYYPPQDVLQAAYTLSSYDWPLIQQYLNALTPDNMLIVLMAPDLPSDRLSSWYATPYQVTVPDSTVLQQWCQAGVNDAIVLPKSNPFIAETSRLVPNAPVSDHPQLMTEERGLQLWWQPDHAFPVPKGHITVALLSPQMKATPAARARLNLAAALLNDQINESLYPARLAGLHYTVAATDYGLQVHIRGFSDKQEQLLQTIIQALRQPVWHADDFRRIKQALIRETENQQQAAPYQRLVHTLPRVLLQQRPQLDQLLAAYPAITLDDVQNFMAEHVAAAAAKVLVYGHYSRATAQAIADQWQWLQQNTMQSILMDVATLPATDTFSYALTSDHPDTALLWYLQGPDTSPRTHALMQISTRLLQADFFHQLRTEQQLGYIVLMQNKLLQDVPGLFFLVQSPVAGPVVLQQAMMTFLNDWALSSNEQQEAFEQQRQMLIQHWLQPAQNQSQQNQLYWRAIMLDQLNFDRREQRVAALEDLTFDQWLHFFKHHIADPQPHGLWLYTEQVL